MDNGWDASAQAWIDSLGTDGDWARRYVLDAPMMARVVDRSFRRAVDIGCGEGRFCRTLRRAGIVTTGIDPTVALIDHARRLDPEGDYRVSRAEALALPDATFDLAVSYLSLIDIDDIHAAIAEAHRVLVPGGTFLIANLNSFNTAGMPTGWSHEPDGSRRFSIDHYLDERAVTIAWKGIRIVNWHRPLQTYMQALLGVGFELRHFAEPAPVGATDDAKTDRYRRVPYFWLMEWQKR